VTSSPSASSLSALRAAFLLSALAGCGGQETRPAAPAGPAREDGEGTVRILPGDPVPAGSFGSWTIEWVAGPSGLPEAGGVVLQVSPWWNWSPPQVRRPGIPGYTTARCAAEGIGVDLADAAVPMAVVARPAGGPLGPGDTLRFCYGDTASGGAASLARADSYAERFEEFLVKTDGNGDGWFEPVADQPTIEIVPGDASGLAVATRTVLRPGDEAEVRVHALDGAGNRTSLPRGDLTLVLRRLVSSTGEEAAWADTLLSREEAGGRAGASARTVFRRPGLCRLEASLAREGMPALAGHQELVLVESGSPFEDLLWGDIHAHSALSDGTGAPEDLYAFARDVAGLDVCSVTDHDAHGLFPLAERGGWETVRAATRDAYDPGEFVTLLGYEWTSWTWGHRNVYYPGDEGEVFEFRAQGSDTPAELWRAVAPFAATTIPHHPAGGPVAVDWSVPSDEDREHVVEICSIHGSSEFAGAERAIYRPVEGAFVRDAFRLGHRLGILAAGDTHDGHPGRRTVGAATNGLAAFRTGERTREAVLRAVRERRVYGTSGVRILLASRWGTADPGTFLAARPEGPIVVEVAAPEPVELVEIVGPDGPVATEYGGGRRVRRRFEDPGAEAPPWLYVRVVLADGEVAWDSPWWLSEPVP
jgi:hypothetical protein